MCVRRRPLVASGWPLKSAYLRQVIIALHCASPANIKSVSRTVTTIGTLTASDNGYTGSVKTLTLNVKAKFVATEKDNDKSPDFRRRAMPSVKHQLFW